MAKEFLEVLDYKVDIEEFLIVEEANSIILSLPGPSPGFDMAVFIDMSNNRGDVSMGGTPVIRRPFEHCFPYFLDLNQFEAEFQFFKEFNRSRKKPIPLPTSLQKTIRYKDEN